MQLRCHLGDIRVMVIGTSLFRQCLVVVGLDNDAIPEPSGWITV